MEDPSLPLETPARTGQKPLALMISGLDGTGRFFEPHQEALAARYRVIAWEFRRRPRFDFADLVEELGSGTSGEKPGSIAVVGESFGGSVAMHYVLAFPERIRLLALINTFSYYPGRLRIRLGCRLAPVVAWRGVRNVKNVIADRLLAMEGIPPKERKRYREIVKLIDQKAYRRRLELVRDTDLRDRLKEIPVPTLIFASGRDRIVPSITAARYMAARIPHARVHEFPRAGHALLLTPGFSLADYI